MAAQSGALERVRQYANHVEKTDALPEDVRGSDSDISQAAHEARLSKTITGLQARLQEQRTAIEEVC